MRLFAFLLGLFAWSGMLQGRAPDSPRDDVRAPLVPPQAPNDAAVHLAALGDSLPGLLVRTLNQTFQGRIDPHAIRYQAPSTVILDDTVLTAPDGTPVARVGHVEATVSLSSLLAGEIVISHVLVDEPKLLLSMRDGELNLLSAFKLRKPGKDQPPPNIQIRLDDIVVHHGGFRFIDGEQVTVVLDGLDAGAHLDVDVGRSTVLLDVTSLSFDSGAVRVPELDVDFTAGRVQHVRLAGNHLDVQGLVAQVLGAALTASGTLELASPGALDFHGTLDAPANTWPARLTKLPFDTPPIRANLKVTGPYTKPLIAVEGDLGHTEAFGYIADGGHVNVVVTPDLVKMLSGTRLVAGGGTLDLTGELPLATLALDLDVRATHIAAAAALRPAEFDPAPRGNLSARMRVRGVVDGKHAIHVDGTLSGDHIEMVAIKAPPTLDGEAHVTVDGLGEDNNTRVVLRDTVLQGEGVRVTADGTVAISRKRIDLDVHGDATDGTRLVPDIPEAIHARTTTFTGTVSGPFSAVLVEGDALITNGTAYGVPVDDVAAHVQAGGKEVRVSQVHARAAGASLRDLEPIVIDLDRKVRTIAGRMSARHVDLARIRTPDGSPLPLVGHADLQVRITGPLTDPTVDAGVHGTGVVVEDELLDDVTGTLRIDRRVIIAEDVVVHGALVDARSSRLDLGIDKLDIVGVVDVDAIHLAMLSHGHSAKLSGSARGPVRVAGEVRAPVVDGHLRVRDLSVGPMHFGDGTVDGGLLPDPVRIKGESTNHTVSVGAHFASDAGDFDVRAAYAIERDVVNADVMVDHVDAAPLLTSLQGTVAPLFARISGGVRAQGPLRRLDVEAHLTVPSLEMEPVTTSTSTATSTLSAARDGPKPHVVLGPVRVNATLRDGLLDADVCLFRDGVPDAARACDATAMLSVHASGPAEVLTQKLALDVDAHVRDDNLEQLVVALGTRELHVGAEVSARTHIVHDDKSTTVSAEARLLALDTGTVGTPTVSLLEPVDLSYEHGRVTLRQPVHLGTPAHDVDVMLRGYAGSEDLAVDVTGAVSFATAKLFTSEIANAQGIADTDVHVEGRYADGLQIRGSVTPRNGAVVTPRALGAPITFNSGSLRVSPAAGNKLRVDVDELKFRYGDGAVVLRGDIDVRTTRAVDEAWVSRFHLVTAGSGVEVRAAGAVIEAAFDLTLNGDDKTPLLRGRVEMSEGTLRKRFDVIDNFVFAQAPGRPSTPMYQTLAPMGLSGLQLDVALSVQNFRARAEVIGFSVDTTLRGDLQLKRTLRLPLIAGAIEASEGTISFPQARFENLQLQLEFPTGADGRIDPKLHLSARAEIEPGRVGNDAEIPIDLVLEGSFTQMQLDLTATDPSREWTRVELFRYIVLGIAPKDVGQELTVNAAIRALSSELTGTLTTAIEKAVASKLGLNFELDAAGWRLQLGPRVQVDGAGLLSLTTDTSAIVGGTATTNLASAADVVRLRLLIADHLAFGRSLSLEGRAGSGGSDLRLSYRIFEQ